MYEISKTKDLSNKVNRALNKDNIIEKYNRRKKTIEIKNQKKINIFLFTNAFVIAAVYLLFFHTINEIIDGNVDIIIEDLMFKIKFIGASLFGFDILFAAFLLKFNLRTEKYINKVTKKGQIKDVRKTIKENSKEIFSTIIYLRENNNISYLHYDFVQMIINIRNEDIKKEEDKKRLKEDVDQLSIKEYYLECDNLIENSIIENN